jgi:tetratricopeptide (TPR) repeat protein
MTVRSRLVRLVILLSVAATFISCGQEFPQLRVVRGNYSVSRGDYQKAIVDYLRAREHSEYVPWISYNLGNVYHFLGEAEAAVEQWNRAQNVDVPDLQFGAAFNRGVYYFEQGRYEEALEQFRFALLVDPSNRAAKQNFEITYERLESGSGLTRDSTSMEEGRSGESGGEESTATRMLDYVRRKEEQRWRANAERSPTEEVRDW